jgi:flavorubredoxin
VNKGKLCGAFGSYGWSGEAVGQLTARLSGLKLKFFGEGVRANFVPSEEELAAAREYAAAFGEELLLKL